tara:strand:+ start:15042 stop:16355 length:1314 start_codon:yes stop_codon:yes gene_type:complete
MANGMTRPGLLAFQRPSVAQRFLDMVQPPAPSVTMRRTMPFTTPSGVVPAAAMDAAQLSAYRAQQRPAPRVVMPLEQAAMRGSMIPRGPRLPAAPRTMADAFRQPLTSPTGQGIAAAALTGLEYGGPSLQPTSLGQGLARMGAAGLKAYTDATAAQAAQDMAMQKLDLDRQRLATERLRAEAAMQTKPKITTAMANAEAMGLVRGTPAYNDFIKRSVEAGGTKIFMGGDKQKELAYKAALDTRGVMQKQVGQDRELAARLETAIDLLRSGAETGRIQSALMPLKQIGREFGFLTDEQVRDLSEQEIIEAAAAFLTPRMRVTGSGASSDRDMNFFQRATVRMANTPEANLVIATMQKQVMDYNKRRLSLFDSYVQKEGHDFGFGDYADEQQGSVYQRVGTDEDFTKMIDDGKIKPGDVFFNAVEGVNEFQIYDPEEMG